MYRDFKRAGKVFEDELSFRISTALMDFPHKIIRNARMYSEELKKITEIDLILLTPVGVFVIEAKSYRTFVAGKVSERIWTGRTGRYKTIFLNPLTQNQIHKTTYLRRMKELYGVVNLNIIDLVCFRNSCNIEVDSNKALNLDDLINMIIRANLSMKERYNVNRLYKNTIKILEVDG